MTPANDQNKRFCGNDKSNQESNEKIVLPRKRRGCVLNLPKANKRSKHLNISVSNSLKVNISSDSNNLSIKTTKVNNEQLPKPKAENININRYNLRPRKNLISTYKENGYRRTQKDFSTNDTKKTMSKNKINDFTLNANSGSLPTKDEIPANSTPNSNTNQLMTIKSSRNNICEVRGEIRDEFFRNFDCTKNSSELICVTNINFEKVPHTKRSRNSKESSETQRKEEASSTSHSAYKDISEINEDSSKNNCSTQTSSKDVSHIRSHKICNHEDDIFENNLKEDERVSETQEQACESTSKNNCITQNNSKGISHIGIQKIFTSPDVFEGYSDDDEEH